MAAGVSIALLVAVALLSSTVIADTGQTDVKGKDKGTSGGQTKSNTQEDLFSEEAARARFEARRAALLERQKLRAAHKAKARVEISESLRRVLSEEGINEYWTLR